MLILQLMMQLIQIKIMIFEIDYYICWGTPNDLKTFQYWQNCFDKWDAHPYKSQR